MFGHSLGGATAAKAMAADARLSAGINLDGSMFLENPALHQNVNRLGEQLAEQLGDRAFMTMTHQGHDTHSDPSLAGFWSHQRVWRERLAATGAHTSSVVAASTPSRRTPAHFGRRRQPRARFAMNPITARAPIAVLED
jgi:Platelet-activating factor acetylhydrolase, isoform II